MQQSQLYPVEFATGSHSIGPVAKKSHPRWFYFVSITVGLAILPLCCLFMELGYRVVKLHSLAQKPSSWVADPQLIYKLNPVNPDSPQSFRGKAPSPDRNGVVRVVCLGGSTTFGARVKAEQAFPAVTERVLKSDGVAAEVINAGVPGYGSRQLLLRYGRDIAALQPDYVIIYEGWNRTGALVDSAEWVPFGYYDITRPGEQRFGRIEAYFISHSLILQKFYTKAAHRQARTRMPRQLLFQLDPHQDLWTADFRQLVLQVHDHHQQPILVVYPALYFPEMTSEERSIFERKLWAQRPFQHKMLTELENKHTAIRQIAISTRTPVVDVQAVFSSFRGQERSALFFDEMHLTPRGNEKAGEVIAGFLADLVHNPRTSRTQAALPPVKPGNGSTHSQ
jgi:lysophospholipase L1-like esterase